MLQEALVFDLLEVQGKIANAYIYFQYASLQIENIAFKGNW